MPLKEVFVLAVLLVSIVTAVQNPVAVTLNVLFWKFTFQKGLLILIFLILGFVIGRLAPGGKK